MTGPVLECSICLQRGAKGAQGLQATQQVAPALTPGRMPRLARLLALAHKFERLLRQGVVADYATLARLGQVSRARITQITNLLHLAPAIQEEILFLPRTVHGRDPLLLRHVQPIARTLDWRRQCALWRKLLADTYSCLLTESPGGCATAEVTVARHRGGPSASAWPTADTERKEHGPV